MVNQVFWRAGSDGGSGALYGMEGTQPQGKAKAKKKTSLKPKSGMGGSSMYMQN